jgi:hypothetical protein
MHKKLHEKLFTQPNTIYPNPRLKNIDKLSGWKNMSIRLKIKNCFLKHIFSCNGRY